MIYSQALSSYQNMIHDQIAIQLQNNKQVLMSLQDRDIKSSSRGTTRNFIEQNIIGMKDADKEIPKHLLQIIVPVEKRPLSLLRQNNQLTHYLGQNAPELVQEVAYLYDKINEFKLLKFGEYVGDYGQSYLIFSNNIVALLKQNQRKWKGFCYRISKSVYIGQFVSMKSEGEGKALFIEQYKDETKINKKLYHFFEGKWKSGEITNGKRQSHNDYYNQHIPLIQYSGDFLNFQFHGQGIKKRNNKSIEGKFQKGTYSPIQTDAKPLQNVVIPK